MKVIPLVIPDETFELFFKISMRSGNNVSDLIMKKFDIIVRELAEKYLTEEEMKELKDGRG